MIDRIKILFIGQFNEQHIGFHFQCAAQELNIPHHSLEISLAKSESKKLNSIVWKLDDKTYWHQTLFQKKILEAVEKNNITHTFVMGTSAVEQATLLELKKRKVYTINFATDDPWNFKHYAQWFLSSLKAYDLILTPRKSNLNNLQSWSTAKICHLPFAYNPRVHFEADHLNEKDKIKYSCDIMFFGGADADRLPYIEALIKYGFSIRLYGGYWDSNSLTKKLSMGLVNLETLRKAIKSSKLCLNLVRRANRDGHVMRSFEIPAMGGCLLTENTSEHFEIFGSNTVKMFSTPHELVKQAELLIKSDELRQTTLRLSQEKIVSEKNTYKNRLETILRLATN